MPKAPFRFKQFQIHQDSCAMKVGTDGVLLGAWASITHQPASILDIGSGTGLIALMLAQRSNATQIDGIEIEAAAYEQCVHNFEASPWNDRLFCYHASFQEFAIEIDQTYELIVSNPPFYTESFSSGNDRRDIARQNNSLPFSHLIQGASFLLHPERGKLATIIPYKEEETLCDLAKTFGLFPEKICRVQGTPSAPIKRSLLLFGCKEVKPTVISLIIEHKRQQYTNAYKTLTKDFYLSF